MDEERLIVRVPLELIAVEPELDSEVEENDLLIKRDLLRHSLKKRDVGGNLVSVQIRFKDDRIYSIMS